MKLFVVVVVALEISIILSISSVFSPSFEIWMRFFPIILVELEIFVYVGLPEVSLSPNHSVGFFIRTESFI